jgi:hypothetical protein
MSLLPDDATFHERVQDLFTAYRGRGVSLSSDDVDLVQQWADAMARKGRPSKGVQAKYVMQVRRLIPSDQPFPSDRFTTPALSAWLHALPVGQPNRYQAALSRFAKFGADPRRALPGFCPSLAEYPCRAPTTGVALDQSAGNGHNRGSLKERCERVPLPGLGGLHRRLLQRRSRTFNLKGARDERRIKSSPLHRLCCCRPRPGRLGKERDPHCGDRDARAHGHSR